MEVGGGDEATSTPVPPEVITKIASCLEELNKCLKEAHHTTVGLGRGRGGESEEREGKGEGGGRERGS